MAELEGKVAFITGAGRLRGIGRAAAIALARLGADIVITGTGRDPASFPEDEKAIGWRDVESVAEQVRAQGRRALPLVFDVTDAAQVEAAVARTVEELGRVDILVNNAAVARGEDRTAVELLEPDVFQRVVDVKVRGTFLCTQAVIKRLYAQGEGGKIVNISSVAGKRGNFVRFSVQSIFLLFALHFLEHFQIRFVHFHPFLIDFIFPLPQSFADGAIMRTPGSRSVRSNGVTVAGANEC